MNVFKKSLMYITILLLLIAIFRRDALAEQNVKHDTKETNIIINHREIEGYSDPVSVYPGDKIQFKIHCRCTTYSIVFQRYGEKVVNLLKVNNLPGKIQNYTETAYMDGANWSTNYTLQVPSNWISGLYAARLFDGKQEFYITFVVKNKHNNEEPPIVVLAATNTWEAYNDWGGASFYKYNLKDGSSKKYASIISFDRPNPLATPLGKKGDLANAERYVLSWLEKNGYKYSMLSDWDLNHDPNILQKYKIVIINTHSEYWTKSMYDGLTNFLNHGGKILNLSGNSIYWKVDIKGNQMEVRKNGDRMQFTNEKGGKWRNLGRPESALLGTGYSPNGFNTTAPYKVLKADHWVFRGTGLHNGDLVGEKGLNGGGASGGETDKVDSHSPKDIVILAKGVNPHNGGADMVYYIRPDGGEVFSVGSIAFGGSLVVDSQLSRIVKNVMDHFLEPGTNTPYNSWENKGITLPSAFITLIFLIMVFIAYFIVRKKINNRR